MGSDSLRPSGPNHRLDPAALLDAIRDAVIYTDLEGRILYWNAAATDLFGYPAEEMLGRTPEVLYPDASAERLSADLGEIASGRDFKGSWRGRRKDGSEVWVEVQTTLVPYGSGRPVGFLGISRDISERLAAEATLRASEGRFRALAETASDGIVAIDADSRILFANPGIERIFGYPVGELLDTDLTTLMPGYLRHLHRAGMKRYLRTGTRQIHWALTELPGRHRDGHIIPLEISFGESRSGGRHIFTGIIRDITARKRIERRLTIEHTVAQVLALGRSEEGILGQVLEALTPALGWPWGAIWVRDEIGGTAMRCAAFWTADPAGFQPYADRTERLRVAPNEGLPGRVWATGAPVWVSDVAKDPTFVRGPEAALLGLHAGIAFPVQRQGQTQAVIEFLAHRVEEPDAELLGLMTTVGVQIGQFLERRRAEAALAQSEERYRSLVQATAQLVWLCDPVGNIVEELPSWTAYTGQPFEVYRGFGWVEAVHPDDREALLNSWRVAVAARRPLREIEARIRRADGFYGTFAIRAVPIFDRAGEVTEWVGTCTDVTARKQHEERMRQSDRMETVGRLAGGVAHEANNQLAVVLGSAEFVLRRPDLPEGVREDMKYIRQAAEQTATITSQLLAFSRRQLLQPKLLDLDQEVKGLEPIIRRTLGESVTLLVRPSGVAGRVRADPGQLAQVMLNLTFNARDAMPEGGTLTIRTGTVELTEEQAAAYPDEGVLPGHYAVLVVSDTGHGMDRSTLDRIFEPFFTTKPVGRGTGLGLSSVHGIVRQSGGYVRASSEPGVGATFEIYLPVVSAESEGGTTVDPVPCVRGSGTVLIAEDEPLLRGIVARSLREAGYTILEAADGEEALALARKWDGPIDLVVTDVVMPRMSGHTLGQQLRRDRPGTRMLFISGFPDLEVVERGLVAAGEPFLQKPFPPEALLRIVAEVMAPTFTARYPRPTARGAPE
jgi:PAS domain S-box-containing protein